MRSPYLFLLFLTGCPNTEDKTDTGPTGTDDSGDTDVTYETGCITIDGGGGYANLADAVTVASDGAVIELCAGTYEEAVTVDKAVTIRGTAMDSVFLNGPGSDVPLTITGAGVTVEELTLSSPRTAIVLSGATSATLTNLTVSAAGSWGLSSTSSTATVSGLTIVEPAAGGVEVSGGEVVLTNLTIDYPAGFGIWAADDAIVTLDTGTITGTLLLSDDPTVDGQALHVEGAELDLSNLTIDGSEGMGLMAEDAIVTLTNTTISDAYFLAIYAFDSTYDLTGLTVSGTYLQGIYATGPSFTMSSSTVTADATSSCSYLYDDWGGDADGPWCGGMLVVADTITLTDVDVSGWNNYAYLLQPDSEDLATVTIDGGSIDDVGRWGAYLYAVDATVSGLTVSNIRDEETTAADTLCYYVDRAVGLLSVSSTINAEGLTIQDNVGWGLVNLFGTANVGTSNFGQHDCAALCNYQGSATISSSTFTGGSTWGGVYDQEGVLTLDGNTFTNNHDDSYYSFESGGSVYTYGYDTGQARDISSYSSATVNVTNNTFEDGDAGLFLYMAGEVVVTGNSWTNYESFLNYFYFGTTVPAYVANNTADSVVGPIVYSFGSEVEIDDFQIGSTRLSGPMHYIYMQDELVLSEYDSYSSSTTFYAAGYYYDDGATVTDLPASLTMEDVNVTESYSSLFYLSDAELDVSGMTVGDVGGYGVYGGWNSYTPDIEMSDVAIASTTYTALYLTNYNPDAFGSVTLTNFSLGSTQDSGVYTSAFGEIDLTEVDLGSVGTTGLETTSRSYDYYYDSTTGTYIYTDLDSATAVTIDGLAIADAGSTGLDLEGGSAEILGATIGATGSYGMSFEGLTSAGIADSTIAEAGTYGIVSTDTYETYSNETSAYISIDGDTAVSLDGVTVTDSGSTGMTFTGGTVLLSDCSTTGSAGVGVALSSLAADVQYNDFSDNGTYGMSCSDVTLDACATNTSSDNPSGSHDGCSDTCFE